MNTLSRRHFFKLFSGAMVGGGFSFPAFGARKETAVTGPKPFFLTRGVVLVPEDLTLSDWPERAQQAGLNTIGLHHGASPRHVVDFIRSDIGQRFVERCRHLGLQVEYELHAMRELLPRGLFAKNRDLFRVNERGERTADYNLCIHSNQALEIAGENAVALAKVLRPTTGRYFFWGDDARPWCRCNRCVELSDSDQSLILENRLIAALRRHDPRARLAHLAYSNTLSAPAQIKPVAGIFLEFAPIDRAYNVPFAKADDKSNGKHLEALDANLRLFGREHAQALEYWLDVSRFSRWKKPAVKLPFKEEVLAADLDTYGSRGIRHLTTFAVFIDADYVRAYGDPVEVKLYGERLTRWRQRKL